MSNYPRDTQRNEYKRLYFYGDALRDISAAGESVLQISNDKREASYVTRNVAFSHAKLCATLDPRLVGSRFLMDIEQFVTERDYEKVKKDRPNLEEIHESNVQEVLDRLQGYGRISHLAHAEKLLRETVARIDALLRYQVTVDEVTELASRTKGEISTERMQRWIDAVREGTQLLEAQVLLSKMRRKVGGARTELIQYMIEHKLPASKLDMTDDEKKDLPSFLL